MSRHYFGVVDDDLPAGVRDIDVEGLGDRWGVGIETRRLLRYEPGTLMPIEGVPHWAVYLDGVETALFAERERAIAHAALLVRGGQ